MDGQFSDNTPGEETLDSSTSPETTTVAEVDGVEASQPFVGRWNRLVSTTNWEKGRIIAQWRDSLQQSDAPVAEYSDEAWSKLVGGVTGQHAGRLRRVAQRFGKTRDQYDGLFWSHFQAAVDWDDAEMWLEGASQNSWSVSKMRNNRWETLGQVEADRPQDGDIVLSETDEDAISAEDATPEKTSPSFDGETSPRHDGSDFGDEDDTMPDASSSMTEIAPIEGESIPAARPFASLGELPDDVAEAFEAYKIVILRHKAASWKDVSAEELIDSLEALKELALAPSVDGGSAPF